MIVQMKDVKKHYKQFELDCTMEIQSGRITGLVGQNGAGKTTAFKAVLGLISTDGGEITVLGKNPSKLLPSDKTRIGVVLSDGGFNEYLTVKNVASVMSAFYPDFDKMNFLQRCDRSGLQQDKKIKDYSSGMKAKLKVLAAMSHDTDLLVLDEPTAGLDVVARDEILDMLRDYMMDGERGILISSHIATDLEGICDDFYMIHEGKIVLHEETDVLLSEYGVLKVDEETYAKLDRQYISQVKKETFGYRCLTKNKQFYLENYPGIVVENGNLDEVILMTIKGERI
ncbi:ABC-2 type transport system ATP-binding protein [Hespellia stercorisuis DSM 15480]|uniref:ABC-2 type transport system ATP-binding protein n=1 Tax=Hespellia stercorisuis DSM 15480 TaxID=1121950 RepID=A0A1M6JTB0_9FIRM|nr:ABC transporter ATP-binding protein [Hespellia stercorisuis]SHJ49906.1 ABC-2 type transport system ATP-binding protein [Hespellia stercorisuis DSM 15480]